MEQVPTVLTEAPPGKPTDSAIEIIPPRRPRPGSHPVRGRGGATEPHPEPGSVKRTVEITHPEAVEGSPHQPLPEGSPEVFDKPPAELQPEVSLRDAEAPLPEPNLERITESVQRALTEQHREAGRQEYVMPPKHTEGALPEPSVDHIQPEVEEIYPLDIPIATSGLIEQTPVIQAQANAQPAPAHRTPTVDSVQLTAPIREIAPSQEVSPTPEMVETDIGPLPSDLWHLLGETPPGISAQEPFEPASRPQPASTAAVMRAVEAAESSPVPALRITPHVPLAMDKSRTTIQRDQATESPETTTTQAPGEASETEATAESLTEDLDTDELSRRVYAEIKRRLSIEWERIRRRF